VAAPSPPPRPPRGKRRMRVMRGTCLAEGRAAARSNPVRLALKGDRWQRGGDGAAEGTGTLGAAPPWRLARADSTDAVPGWLLYPPLCET